jgi:hypothetical protein
MDAVDYLWEIVKDLVRTLPSAAEEEISFMIYGHPLGLSEFESVILELN